MLRWSLRSMFFAVAILAVLLMIVTGWVRNNNLFCRARELEVEPATIASIEDSFSCTLQEAGFLSTPVPDTLLQVMGGFNRGEVTNVVCVCFRSQLPDGENINVALRIVRRNDNGVLFARVYYHSDMVLFSSTRQSLSKQADSLHARIKTAIADAAQK